MYLRLRLLNCRFFAVLAIFVVLFILLKNCHIQFSSRIFNVQAQHETAGQVIIPPTHGSTVTGNSELKRNVISVEGNEIPTRNNVSATKKQMETIKEKERKYYQLRQTKTDHCDFEYLVKGLTICEDQMPFLLVIIPSPPDHAEIRQVIRETWGQYVSNTSLPPPHSSKVIKLAFLLGIWNDPIIKKSLLAENKQFRDIVVGNFRDSYRNLTRKILLGLKWMSAYCGEADYILKADEDIFVNIPRLLDTLTEHPATMTGSVYGYLYGGGTVKRHGKWAVSKDQYPLPEFPPYMSGTSYVLSGNTAPRLLMASQHMPYLPIEDAFITGILPKINDISQIHIKEFTIWKERSPVPCTFLQENRISANRVDANLMRQLWIAQQNFPMSCFNKERENNLK